MKAVRSIILCTIRFYYMLWLQKWRSQTTILHTELRLPILLLFKLSLFQPLKLKQGCLSKSLVWYFWKLPSILEAQAIHTHSYIYCYCVRIPLLMRNLFKSTSHNRTLTWVIRCLLPPSFKMYKLLQPSLHWEFKWFSELLNWAFHSFRKIFLITMGTGFIILSVTIQVKP